MSGQLPNTISSAAVAGILRDGAVEATANRNHSQLNGPEGNAHNYPRRRGRTASYSGRCGCVDLVDELDADGFDCLANRRAIGRIHLSQSTWSPGRGRARINAIDSNKIGFVS